MHTTTTTPDIKRTPGIIVGFACGRFVFAIPPATASCITMHTSHPPPSSLVQQRAVDLLLRSELTPRARCLHHITMSSAVQFPELRLIQYDCGTSFQPRLFICFLNIHIAHVLARSLLVRSRSYLYLYLPGGLHPALRPSISCGPMHNPGCDQRLCRSI